jgi:hypothetical protein
MAAAQLQLKTNQLIEQIDALVISSPYYLARDSMAVGRIDRDIRTLLKIDPAGGWTLRAVYSAMVGDEEALRNAFTALSNISQDLTSQINLAGSFATLGYFSEAQGILTSVLNARNGEFSAGCIMASKIGMFSRVANEMKTAPSMKMPIPCMYAGVRDSPLAASILEPRGVSDEEVAAQLDAMGEVLRKHKRPAGQVSMLALDVENVFTGVSIQYHVRMPKEAEVSQMNLELTRIAERRGLQTHNSLVVLFATDVKPA